MVYCTLIIMSEAKAIFNFIKYDKKDYIQILPKGKGSDFSQDVSRHLLSLIAFPTLFMCFLSVLWDFMLIVTSIYYHTIELLGIFLGMSMWYLLYKLIFKPFNLI